MEEEEEEGEEEEEEEGEEEEEEEEEEEAQGRSLRNWRKMKMEGMSGGGEGINENKKGEGKSDGKEYWKKENKILTLT